MGKLDNIWCDIKNLLENFEFKHQWKKDEDWSLQKVL